MSNKAAANSTEVKTMRNSN